MSPKTLFSGTPTVGQLIKLDIDAGDQSVLYVVGTGDFAANLTVLKGPESNFLSSADADYLDIYENGSLVSFSATHSVQEFKYRGEHAVKVTAVDGNVEVFCY